GSRGAVAPRQHGTGGTRSGARVGSERAGGGVARVPAARKIDETSLVTTSRVGAVRRDVECRGGGPAAVWSDAAARSAGPGLRCDQDAPRPRAERSGLG